MSMRYYEFKSERLEPAEKILRAAIHSWSLSHDRPEGIPARAFVTVSRQPGAGAISFSHRLAARLNETGAGEWSAWDRELVEKVSAEHGIAAEIINKITTRRHNWLEELLQSFSSSEIPPDVAEIRAYERVAATIRALAACGHAVIVGLGGAFITRNMPGGIHLRLIAPLEYRIQCTAEYEKISIHEAAARLVEIDRRRSEFYRRFWPGKVVAPEAFTMTINSARMSLDELVECVIPLVRMRQTVHTCCCGQAPRSEGAGPEEKTTLPRVSSTPVSV